MFHVRVCVCILTSMHERPLMYVCTYECVYAAPLYSIVVYVSSNIWFT